jgi:nucleolar pre-ribosomal-associated protein 1
MNDESEVVNTFLDECVQKCLKTPHKYVDALRSLAAASSANDDYTYKLDEYPSPLLMTLLEQLESRLSNGSLPATHIVAVTSFIGRLTFCLLGKKDLVFLRAFVDKVENVLMQNSMLDASRDRTEITMVALKRELAIMRSGMAFNITIELETAVEVEGAPSWLTAFEALSTRRSL